MIKRTEIIGDATLYLGDCREILPMLGKVDAVVTDPPYFGREDLFPTEAVQECFGALQPFTGFVFWPWYGLPPAQNETAIHIWHKAVPIHPNSQIGNVAGHQYERIFAYNAGAKAEVFRCAAIMPGFAACSDEFAKHPTQKPVSLVRNLVGRIKSRTILDPFMGSGTTGVACIREGRKFIGIEIDEGYFDIACKRIRDEYARPRLALEPAPQPVQEGFEL